MNRNEDAYLAGLLQQNSLHAQLQKKTRMQATAKHRYKNTPDSMKQDAKDKFINRRRQIQKSEVKKLMRGAVRRFEAYHRVRELQLPTLHDDTNSEFNRYEVVSTEQMLVLRDADWLIFYTDGSSQKRNSVGGWGSACKLGVVTL